MLSFDKYKLYLEEKFPNVKFNINEQYLELLISFKEIFEIIKELKEDSTLQFNQLIDLTAVDYPNREKRFDIIYILLSMKLNRRILVKSIIDENDKLESLCSIHKASNWYERECYDLFGIQFLNHPDLRRLMTDYNFEGHPLRKDFPLTGETEVRYDDLEKKVVYEPIKLAQEYRNFDYMSPWEGIDNELIGDEKINKEKK